MPKRCNLPYRKEARREAAKLRQEKSDKLSLEQKIAKATPGSREHARLLAKTQK